MAAVGIAGYLAYRTFVAGTSGGADFIAEIKAAHIQASDVRSVRILVPPVGHTPFSRKEMNSLECRAEITSVAKISELISALRLSSQKTATQSHPVSEYQGYWQIDLSAGGFFYLYIDVRRDSASEVCCIAANRKDATNPNGAESYVIDDYKPLFRSVGVEIPK